MKHSAGIKAGEEKISSSLNYQSWTLFQSRIPQTVVVSRAGPIEMAESCSNAGVSIPTVLQNRILEAHHLGCAKA